MPTPPQIERNPSSRRMPVIFAAHGAPVLLDDARWKSELASWAEILPKPKCILMISAHWEERPTTLGANAHGPARAAGGTRPVTTFPITGWWMDGAFTKRSVQFS